MPIYMNYYLFACQTRYCYKGSLQALTIIIVLYKLQLPPLYPVALQKIVHKILLPFFKARYNCRKSLERNSLQRAVHG